MGIDQYLRILRVRMWEMGHSFQEIDSMRMSDVGDILAYWAEKAAIEKKQAAKRTKGKGRK